MLFYPSSPGLSPGAASDPALPCPALRWGTGSRLRMAWPTGLSPGCSPPPFGV